MRVSVRTQMDGLRQQFAALRERDIPFSVELAINRTLEDGRQRLTQEIANAFQAPTAWALRGIRYDKANRKVRGLQGRIYLDDFAGKGIPAGKFLSAEVYGGPRRDKRSERALRAKGLLPEGYFAVPGGAAPLDGHGNIPGSVMTRVLSVLRAFGEQGFKANMVKGSLADRKLQRSGVGYFVGRPGKHLPLGIWERRQFGHGSAVRPFMVFVRTPVYTKRLHFYELWEQVVSTSFPAHLRGAFQVAFDRGKSRGWI